MRNAKKTKKRQCGAAPGTHGKGKEMEGVGWEGEEQMKGKREERKGREAQEEGREVTRDRVEQRASKSWFSLM